MCADSPLWLFWGWEWCFLLSSNTLGYQQLQPSISPGRSVVYFFLFLGMLFYCGDCTILAFLLAPSTWLFSHRACCGFEMLWRTRGFPHPSLEPYPCVIPGASSSALYLWSFIQQIGLKCLPLFWHSMVFLRFPWFSQVFPCPHMNFGVLSQGAESYSQYQKSPLLLWGLPFLSGNIYFYKIKCCSNTWHLCWHLIWIFFK